MKRRSEGSALITVILISFLLLVLSMSLLTLATSGLQLSWQSSQQMMAREAAQAGLARALAQVGQTPDWSGQLQEEMQPQCRYQVQVVNNLQGAGTQSAPNQSVVPPYTVWVLAAGTSPNGRTAHVEALAQWASYPYAVAGSQVTCQGALTVNGAASLDGLIAMILGLVFGGPSTVPGHVWGTQSVMLGPGTNVSGKVRSAGSVVVQPPSVVQGGTQPNQDPEALAQLNISDYDPGTGPEVTQLPPGGPYVGTNFSGPTRIGGDVTLVSPVLTNSKIYIQGNLDQQVSIAGTGSLMVRGKVQLHGVASLVSTTGIAVLADDEIDLAGSGFFQGVLYSRSGIHVHGVQVVGAILCNGPVTLDAGNVTYLPEYTQVGTRWAQQGCLGYQVTGPTPQLRVIYWREGT